VFERRALDIQTVGISLHAGDEALLTRFCTLYFRAQFSQDQGTANALLSNVSISIDWVAAASVASGDGRDDDDDAAADVTSVVVKIGDFDLKFAG
jgi:hypothetical protein